MYGPEMNAISKLGEDGFREHPEFQQLLEYRDIAGQVITDLIEDAQARGVLPSDPLYSEAPSDGDDAFHDLPSIRYLQIAWATMIGVAVLRDDDLLKAVGWDISRQQGARVVAESVLGLDPDSVGSAARTFLSSAGVEPVDVEEMREAEPPPTVGASHLDMMSMDAPLMSMPARSSAASKFSEVFQSLRGHGKKPDEHVERGERLSRVEEPAEQNETSQQEEVLQHEDSPRAEGVVRVEETRPYPPAAGLEDDLSLTTVLGSYPGLRRAAYSRKQMANAQILWIDDRLAGIAKEVETIEHLGARITLARSTEEAIAILEGPQEMSVPGRRIIISDIARDGVPDAGTRAIPQLLRADPDAAILFYIADLDKRRGIPEGAKGITNRTDELLHLLMDVLEGR